MSYSCIKHGWNHVYEPCPSCQLLFTTSGFTVQMPLQADYREPSKLETQCDLKPSKFQNWGLLGFVLGMLLGMACGIAFLMIGIQDEIYCGDKPCVVEGK